MDGILDEFFLQGFGKRFVRIMVPAAFSIFSRIRGVILQYQAGVGLACRGICQAACIGKSTLGKWLIFSPQLAFIV